MERDAAPTAAKLLKAELRVKGNNNKKQWRKQSSKNVRDAHCSGQQASSAHTSAFIDVHKKNTGGGVWQYNS